MTITVPVKSLNSDAVRQAGGEQHERDGVKQAEQQPGGVKARKRVDEAAVECLDERVDGPAMDVPDRLDARPAARLGGMGSCGHADGPPHT